MIDVALDTVTHDLVVSNYDLQLVTEVDQIVQAVKMRLLTIFGEWFLDSREGIQYFTVVCTKNPDLSLIDSIMKATIVETDGVNELMSYVSVLDKPNRSLTITFQINTTYGISATLSLGVP
jgi:hypothetical protein